jgi:hypothetical protein
MSTEHFDFVTAGLVPAIHVVIHGKDVEARHRERHEAGAFAP